MHLFSFLKMKIKFLNPTQTHQIIVTNTKHQKPKTLLDKKSLTLQQC